MITDEPQCEITGAHCCEIGCTETCVVPAPPGIVASGVNTTDADVPVSVTIEPA